MSLPIYRIRAMAIVIVFLLAGCAANGIDPSSLKKPVVASIINLKSDYSFAKKISIAYSSAANEATYSLVSGQYLAEFEDDKGVYYRGPNNCLSISVTTAVAEKAPSRQNLIRQGGIYLPRSPAEVAYLYFYKDSSEFVPTFNPGVRSVAQSPVNALILTHGDGNIIIPDSQPTNGALRSALEF